MLSIHDTANTDEVARKLFTLYFTLRSSRKSSSLRELYHSRHFKRAIGCIDALVDSCFFFSPFLQSGISNCCANRRGAGERDSGEREDSVEWKVMRESGARFIKGVFA